MAEIRGNPDGSERRFAIVLSRFNEIITGRLLAGARACFEEHGVSPDRIDVIEVPGAWELPFAAQLAVRTAGYAAVVALGCVIRGETPHFDYVAGPAADGLTRVSLDAGIPVTFGLLTTENTEQALARAGGRLGNKGWEAAWTALEMADLAHRLERGRAGA